MLDNAIIWQAAGVSMGDLWQCYGQLYSPIVRMVDILHQVKSTDEFLGRRNLGADLSFRISETL
jgi:hypothetical protein